MIENSLLDKQDQLTKFLFDAAPVRGEIIQLEKAWTEMTAHHHYPTAVTSLLGQFTAGAMLLAGTIKFEGALILQVQGDGPVSLLVVEVQNNMNVRAMVKMREGAKVDETASVGEMINANQQGRCAIILDPHDRRPGVEPYQGIVALNGQSVAQILEGYMLQSEQLETRLWLSADSQNLGGLLIQKMPSIGGNAAEAADPDAWERILHISSTVKGQELQQVAAPELLHRLFWQEKIQGCQAQKAQFVCRCSRERIGQMLHSLGQEEVNSILAEEGKVQVNCDFCNKETVFTPEDVDLLFTEDTSELASSQTDPNRLH